MVTCEVVRTTIGNILTAVYGMGIPVGEILRRGKLGGTIDDPVLRKLWLDAEASYAKVHADIDKIQKYLQEQASKDGSTHKS